MSDPVFIVWKVYQRRVEALQVPLRADTVYFHYAWEERGRVHKALSYLCKFVHTLAVLFRRRPALVYVQAPPTFAIYAAWLYGWLAGVPYVVDAHNPMIYDTFWPRLPLAAFMLRHARSVIVHNRYVAARARELGLSPVNLRVLMDRPPDVAARAHVAPDTDCADKRRPRVVVPCSYDVDEPLVELQRVTHFLPDVDFYITWYAEKLPRGFVRQFGPNTRFTGFLPAEDFNGLLAQADVIVALTTRDGTQPSVATEALAFERPLVVSDSSTIRDLFPQGAVYVENRAGAIAEGIRTALRERRHLEVEMAAFKSEKLRQWESQFEDLRGLLTSRTETS